MKTRELISILERNGYQLIRANKHYLFNRGSVSVTVPRHKEIGIYFAKKILKQAGINN